MSPDKYYTKEEIEYFKRLYKQQCDEERKYKDILDEYGD